MYKHIPLLPNSMITMNTLKLFLCVCLMPGFSLYAQVRIHGKVTDLDNQPLAYSTVRLLKTDSAFISGTTTDTLGYYQFTNVQPDKYLLAFSTIGYKPQIIPASVSNQDTQLPVITLESDNVILNEVVVKGSSYVRKTDHVLVIPDKQQVKHAGTGYDLLYNLMIPSLEVNKRTGKVSTFGGEVALYINGEKAEYEEVQNLRPRDIKNIEYYDTPTGKYAGDVASINYITKERTSGGYVSLDGKQTIGYLMGNYNIGTKLMHGNNSYSVLGGYITQKYDGVKTSKNEEILFPEYTTHRNTQTTQADYQNNQQYLQLKANNRTEKHNISAQLSLVHNETPKNNNSELLDYSGHHTYSISSANQKKEDGLSPSVKLYGNFNITPKQTLEVTAKTAYTQNDYTRTYTEGENISLTDVDEELYAFDFSTRYNIKLEHNNSLGANLQHHHKVTSSSYTGDYDSWQHLWMGETMFFLNYNQRIAKKFSMNFLPGFSWLNYKLHTDARQQHWSLRMNSTFIYTINKSQQLMASVDIGNDQPDISYINSMDQTVDFLQIKRGNPHLDNTKLYVVGIAYKAQLNRLNFQILGVYQKIQNNISTDYYLENDKLVSSFRSDMDVEHWNAALDLSYRFSDNLRAKFNARYYHTIIPGEYNITDNSVIASLDINYYWKNLAINVYGSTATSRINRFSLAIEKNPAIYGTSISWRHKGWHVETGTENPFTKHNRYREYANFSIYNYSRIQTSRINQRTGYIKIAYTFDFGQKTSREKSDMDRNINSAIMKTN